MSEEPDFLKNKPFVLSLTRNVVVSIILDNWVEGWAQRNPFPFHSYIQADNSKGHTTSVYMAVLNMAFENSSHE